MLLRAYVEMNQGTVHQGLRVALQLSDEGWQAV
jgi:hypothetical protein